MPTAKCIKICQIFIICINLCDRELPSGQWSVVSRQWSALPNLSGYTTTY
ncbi:MAG TPA: hypothetical protein V6D48_10975 [Oculatellaceae cyanobacterium]